MTPISLSPKSYSLRDGRNATTATVEPDLEQKINSPTLSASLKPEFATVSLFFQPEVIFSPQGGLQSIKLDLDQVKFFQVTTALKSPEMLTYIAATYVYEQYRR